LVINGTETSVGTGSGLLRQQNIHVLVFGDLVGSLVDPLAAELVFLLTLDLPLQIGCFVYQYAKLRMLQFYYDFIDVFVDHRDFQYCSMDTDSAYMALSTDPLQLNLSSFPKQ
jgi:hypothetical protein